MRSMEMTTGTGPSRLTCPPTNPVPPPWGTIPIRRPAQYRTIAAICSVEPGRKTAAACPRVMSRGSSRYGAVASPCTTAFAPTIAASAFRSCRFGSFKVFIGQAITFLRTMSSPWITFVLRPDDLPQARRAVSHAGLTRRCGPAQPVIDRRTQTDIGNGRNGDGLTRPSDGVGLSKNGE